MQATVTEVNVDLYTVQGSLGITTMIHRVSVSDEIQNKTTMFFMK